MQDDTVTIRSLDRSRPGSSSGLEGAGTPSTTYEAGPSTLSEEPEVRRQADPLPAKRGEIGYVEPSKPEPENVGGPSTHDTISPLPAVHPADRRSNDPPAAPSQPSQPSSTPSADNASTHSNGSTHSKLLKFLTPKNIPTFFGIRLTTLLLFSAHIAVFAGTIAAWALIIQHLSAIMGTQNDDTSSSDDGGNFGTGSSQIFVHVAFGVACLAELIFIERRIFRIRAERYCHQHGGLPMHVVSRSGEMTIGFAPWNRPPLPTYAAALAQSGVGTGDVEDNAIAVPPPPAYGNTRGSTLLLSGFMNDSLRAQRAEARERAVERANAEGGLAPSIRESWASRASRPVSYRSHDEEWEERCDAMRSVQLEETLTRLEEGRPRN